MTPEKSEKPLKTKKNTQKSSTLRYNSNELTGIYHLVCPVCDSIEVFMEGRCVTCSSCGWSKCEI